MAYSGQITPHFSWGEARCHCGCEMPESVAVEVVKTAAMMERVRTGLLNHPVHVAAWYRCKQHNADIGGAVDSQHLTGRAVDFSIEGHAPTEIQTTIRGTLWPDPVKGLELDPGHTHVDRRPGRPVVFLADGTIIERRN